MVAGRREMARIDTGVMRRLQVLETTGQGSGSFAVLLTWD
jgi:hypothetical protein